MVFALMHSIRSRLCWPCSTARQVFCVIVVYELLKDLPSVPAIFLSRTLTCGGNKNWPRAGPRSLHLAALASYANRTTCSNTDSFHLYSDESFYIGCYEHSATYTTGLIRYAKGGDLGDCTPIVYGTADDGPTASAGLEIFRLSGIEQVHSSSD